MIGVKRAYLKELNRNIFRNYQIGFARPVKKKLPIAFIDHISYILGVLCLNVCLYFDNCLLIYCTAISL